MTAVHSICRVVDLRLSQSHTNLNFAGHVSVIPLQVVVNCVTGIVLVPEKYFSQRKC